MVIQDLRYGLRALAGSPTFTIIAVVTLALGIAANVSIFSVINAVLLRPLPYDEPDRLVRVWDTNLEQSRDHEKPSPGNFLDWRASADVFEAITAWYQTSRTLRGEHDALQVETVQVSGDFFRCLRTAAALGSTFSPEEAPGAAFNVANQFAGGDRVLVISDALWRQRFGADPEIIGQTVLLDGQGWQVKGVMPAGFAMPDVEAEIWVPWDITRSYDSRRFPEGPPRDFRFLQVLARLKQGVTLEQAESYMAGTASEMAERYPKANKGWGTRLVPLQEEMVGASRPPLLVLFGAVSFVLLIACANVASLLLARASGRQREIAIRAALGATRLQLIRQLLTESVLLSLIAAAFGLMMAFWGLNLLVWIAPPGLARMSEVAIDARVLVFTLALATGAGLIFGLVPALQSSRIDLATSLKEGGTRSSTAGPNRQRFRRLLVASEIAIALVLLVGAGLFAKSFARVLAVNPGFNPENLLVMRIFLDNNAYRTGAQSSSYYRQLVERLGGLASVESVAATTALPMSDVGVDFDRPYWREGEADPGGQAAKAGIRMITPDYFKTMSTPVLKGRAFAASDTLETPRVIIINESFARLVWPGEEAVGKRLVIDYRGGAYAYEVVGLAGDTRYYGLKSRPQPEIFIPHAQNPYLIMNVVARTAIDPEQLAKAFEQEVRALDASQPVHSLVTMERLMAQTIAPERFSLLLLGLLAIIGLVLAAGGIYGVIAYSVTQRTHEIGVRIALGAQASDVLRLVLGESMKLTLVGLGAGLISALALTRIVSSLLYETSATDPVTFTGVSIILAAVAICAAYVPARRAMSLDPIIALRCE